MNGTNVLNVTVKKDKSTQKTFHMLESCSILRWADTDAETDAEMLKVQGNLNKQYFEEIIRMKKEIKILGGPHTLNENTNDRGKEVKINGEEENVSIFEKTDPELIADKSTLMKENKVPIIDNKQAEPKGHRSVKNYEELKVKSTESTSNLNLVILIENVSGNFTYLELKEKLKKTGQVRDVWFDR